MIFLAGQMTSETLELIRQRIWIDRQYNLDQDTFLEGRVISPFFPFSLGEKVYTVVRGGKITMESEDVIVFLVFRRPWWRKSRPHLRVRKIVPLEEEGRRSSASDTE